ncbi:MAG: hypothetical protein Q8P41_27690, partial [Pseudomonadota bacterium]|nr:hypothetical protein [Pseudomonadota bacterium]
MFNAATPNRFAPIRCWMALALAACVPAIEPVEVGAPRLAHAPTASWSADAQEGIAAGEYAPQAEGDTFRVTNRAQDLRATFGSDGLAVSSRTGAGEVGLSLRAWGREDALIAAETPSPEEGDCLSGGAVDAFGDCLRRVDYARPGLVEWWENRPEGLEQGF